jgi:hypothetical protein
MSASSLKFLHRGIRYFEFRCKSCRESLSGIQNAVHAAKPTREVVPIQRELKVIVYLVCGR